MGKKTIRRLFLVMNIPMGLDKEFLTWLNEEVNIKLLLDQLGLGLATLVGYGRRKRVSPLQEERERYKQEAREQFVKLKEKGISIPVFTL